MAIDAFFKCPFSKSETRARLLNYIHIENEEFDEFVLSYADKWAWAFYETTYDENDMPETVLSVKFSRRFSEEELSSLTEEMSQLGFVPFE